MKTLWTSPDQVRARDGFDNALTFLVQPDALVRPVVLGANTPLEG
jgi:hypothetical protein